MAFTYGFYNSKNGDRKYYAEQMAMLVDGLITNGVFMTVGNQFMVKPSSGMSVSVDTGHAWYDATWSHNDSEMIMTASQSDILLDRIDALVLEVDKTESVRENAIKWVVGTPGSNPVKPTLTFEEYLRQRPIAYIRIPANSTEIKAENIEYVVGTSECPFVTGVLEGMNIDNLVAQWGAQWTSWSGEKSEEFNTWFGDIKDTLSEDAAANLYNMITNRMPMELTPYDANKVDSADTFVMQNAANSSTDSLSNACKTYYGTTLWLMWSVAHPMGCVQYAFPYGSKNGYLMRNYNWWDNTWSNWDAVLLKSGGTLTGPLTLSGEPTADLHAATKKYVDDVAMPKSGGTFTGDVYARNGNRDTGCLRNIHVMNSSWTGVSTNIIHMLRK